jgi:hypothetical protein
VIAGYEQTVGERYRAPDVEGWRLRGQGCGNHLAGDRLPGARVRTVDQCGVPARCQLSFAGAVGSEYRRGDQRSACWCVGRRHRSQDSGVDHRPATIGVEVQQRLPRWWLGSGVPERRERLHRGSRNAAQVGCGLRVGGHDDRASPELLFGTTDATGGDTLHRRVEPDGVGWQRGGDELREPAMPKDGTAGEPSTKDRTRRAAKRADVEPSCSARTPARKGPTTPVRSRPTSPACSRSSANVQSGSARIRRTGRSDRAAQRTNRSFSVSEPRGAARVAGNRAGNQRGSASTDRCEPCAATTPAPKERRSSSAGLST